jgi:hypothetical protein
MTQMIRGVSARLADEFASNRCFYILFLFTSIGLYLLVRPGIAGPDTESYLAYTRSLCLDGDILLFNDFTLLHKPLFIVPETLYAVEIHNIGTALFWLPFYALAHLLTLVPLTGSTLLPAADGLGPHYNVWLNAGNWLYGILALLLIYATCRRHFSTKASALATALICLATPFFYYLSSLSPNPHMPGLFLISLFIYLWERTRGERTLAQWACLGTLIGLMVSVANYNITLALLAALDLAEASLLWHRWRLALGQGALFGLCALLGLSPLLIAWWTMYGSPLANPYLQIYFWLQPALIEVLFSSYHGLFTFAPVLLLSVPGLYFLWRRDRRMVLAFLMVFALQTYISSTSLSWWGGSSFGARYFIGLSPIFSLALAALIEQIGSIKGWAKVAAGVALGTLSALCTLWTFLLYMEGVAGLTSNSEFFRAVTLWRKAWEVLGMMPGLALYRWLLPESPLPPAYLVLFALMAFVILRAANNLLTCACGTPVPAPHLCLRHRSRQEQAGAGRGVWPGVGRALTLGGWMPALVFTLLLIFANRQGVVAKARLAAVGFYAQNLPRLNYDPLDLTGAFYERCKYLQAVGRPVEAEHFLQQAFVSWPIRSRALVLEGQEVEVTKHTDLLYSRLLRLGGYRLERRALEPGASMAVTLYWKKLGDDAPDFTSMVELVGQDGGVYGRGEAGDGPPGPFPVRFMPTQTRFSDTLTISLDRGAPGPSLRLRVTAYGLDGRSLMITGRQDQPADGVVGYVRQPWAELPAYTPDHRLNFNLGGKATLIGYDLRGQRASPGQAITLTLYWQAVAPMNEDYTVFVHLVEGETGRIITQQDNPPLAGWYPTSLWESGEVVRDPYRLTLPLDTPPGSHRLEVGMYSPDDGSRLPVMDAQGNQVGDRVILAPITVAPVD